MKTISPAKHISDLPIPKKTISRSDLKTLIPDITDEMMELFLSQSDNIACDPRGRRWSQKKLLLRACNGIVEVLRHTKLLEQQNF